MAIIVGVYFFIVSFFYFVPLDVLINTATKVAGDSSIEATRLHKPDSSTTLIKYNGTEVLEIGSSSIYSFLFINGASLKDIKLKGTMASMLPLDIEYGYILYPFWAPLLPSFWFGGEFGSGSGEIDMSSGVLRVRLTPTEDFKKAYSFLLSSAKQEKGSYIFEYRL